MVNGKIVFLLLLIAICVAVSYAGMWLEWRNRAIAAIQGKSYKAAASSQCGTITRPCGWLVDGPKRLLTRELAASLDHGWPSNVKGTYHVADFRDGSW
jgi:hypothetical protein